MTTHYKCPLCDALMELFEGDGINPKNGFTIVCLNKECPCHENVYGHGTSEKHAYNIAIQKYRKVSIKR